MVKCWKCGSQNDDDYTFCKACGQSRIAGNGYLIIDRSGRTRFLKRRTLVIVTTLLIGAFLYIIYLNGLNYKNAELNYVYAAQVDQEKAQLELDYSKLQTDYEDLQSVSRDILDSTMFMYTQEEVDELRQTYRDEMIADLSWIDQYGKKITTEDAYWQWNEWFRKNNPIN